MEDKKYASTIPACGMIIAILIFAQIPIMFGKADPNAIIYALPWLLSAFPVLLLCIVFMFKNGEFVDATINAVLSGVLMGQNFVRGIIALAMYSNGVEVTPELMMSSYSIDKWVYLAGFGSAFVTVGAIGLVVLGIYLLYSGIAGLLNTALGKKVLPIF